MLRKILSLCLLCVCVSCITSCSNKNNAGESSGIKNNVGDPSGLRFINVTSIEYNNGCAYGDSPTKYLDFETLESSPLCAFPNCTHNNPDCLANIVGNTPIFYNDYVYFFDSNYGDIRETPDGSEFYIDSKLKKASLDSSEIEVVCEFSDCSPEQGFPGIVLKGNEMYFTADNLNPSKDEYGAIEYSNSGGYHFLCCINLDTGKYENLGSIYDGDKEYDGAAYSSCANITGIYNDKMYIRYSFIKDIAAIQNGGNPDELYEHLNFEFDFETREWKEAELPFSWSMNSETYTYYEPDSKLMHVIYNDKETTFSCDRADTECKEYNGKLFVLNEGRFYDLNDMSEHSLGEYNDYEIVGYYNDSYILMNSRKAIKLTEEELLALDKE